MSRRLALGQGLAIGVLAALLVGTKAWWAWQAVDAGITASYTQDSLSEHRQMLAQSLAIIESAGKPGATQESIVAAAQAAGGGAQPFEKDGHVRVGGIGLDYDADGRLAGAETSWSPR